MSELDFLQLVLIGLVFSWTGFVRSGLGFGGAALGLPFLLLIVDNPLVFLPLIGVHMLFFSVLTVGSRVRHVDWRFLKWAMSIMIVPKLIGVFGLLTLPGELLTGIVYLITAIYALTYIFRFEFSSKHRLVDIFLLILGGYISGTSLIGAPLIVAVTVNHVAQSKLRNTLFVLWFILVSIKMSLFVMNDVDLLLFHHLWLLPAAAVGHYFGLKFHDRLVISRTSNFKRILGCVLLAVSTLGIFRFLGP